ncbi:helix-turn-helix domain-containing protein [Curtanaerobium respiraculi]|uniref:helix-turn-helix domain-containing protein n=1 Tax=Curtanaerobium respiraculi TaxID=2949669 RepID=UPI003D185709
MNVAEILQVSQHTIYRLVENGEFPAVPLPPTSTLQMQNLYRLQLNIRNRTDLRNPADLKAIPRGR